MTLEYDIVLARPGYNEKYKKNVSWDELRKSFLLYKRIPMIVAGGSHSGPINPNDAIGFVDAKIDDEDETIRGKAIFYKEMFDKVPAEIQSRLLRNQHVAASLGYEPFEDMRKVDHLAIGVESPVFEDVGFHAESKFYYEETEGIGDKEEPEEKQPEYVTMDTFQSFADDIKGMIQEAITKPEPETPQETPEEEVTEEQETEEPPEEEPSDLQKPPKVEPERKPIKRATSPTGEWLEDEHGRRYLSYQVAGHDKKK